jgi:hypothetical protein
VKGGSLAILDFLFVPAVDSHEPPSFVQFSVSVNLFVREGRFEPSLIYVGATITMEIGTRIITER